MRWGMVASVPSRRFLWVVSTVARELVSMASRDKRGSDVEDMVW